MKNEIKEFGIACERFLNLLDSQAEKLIGAENEIKNLERAYAKRLLELDKVLEEKTQKLEELNKKLEK